MAENMDNGCGGKRALVALIRHDNEFSGESKAELSKLVHCASIFYPRRFRLPRCGLSTRDRVKPVKDVTITLPGDLSLKWRGLWVNITFN